MTHTNTADIRRAYAQYHRSRATHLSDVYVNASYEKQRAYTRCRAFAESVSGWDVRIVSYNAQIFTLGYLFVHDGRTAFMWVTPTYNRFVYLDEIGG